MNSAPDFLAQARQRWIRDDGAVMDGTLEADDQSRIPAPRASDAKEAMSSTPDFPGIPDCPDHMTDSDERVALRQALTEARNCIANLALEITQAGLPSPTMERHKGIGRRVNAALTYKPRVTPPRAALNPRQAANPARCAARGRGTKESGGGGRK